MRADADVTLAVETARLAVEAGAEEALRVRRRPFRVETKADRSPVTEADRASEAAILAVLRGVYPRHAILSEESGAAGEGRDRWIVDPIDGTRGFARGGSFWGPLVAYERDGVVIAGAMALPALGVTYWAGKGVGAFRDGERLRVSAVATLEEATLSLGEMRALLTPPWERGIRALVSRAPSVRCHGDLAGAAMLLDARADVWIEAGVKTWDLAAIRVLVEEAGGRFTDREGKATADAGHAVATNGLLHEAVLSSL